MMKYMWAPLLWVMFMNKRIVLISLMIIFAAGCRSNRTTDVSRQPVPADGYHGPMMGPMMRGPQRSNTELTFKSNGQRIYYTATSNSGQVITASGGPHWFLMHGGSCIDCHGPDGRGGYIVPMTDETSPNITYKALTSEENPPYTDDTIKRAITEGLDPAGHKLSNTMPRWNMADSDLDDLISYLKTLGS